MFYILFSAPLALIIALLYALSLILSASFMIQKETADVKEADRKQTDEMQTRGKRPHCVAQKLT